LENILLQIPPSIKGYYGTCCEMMTAFLYILASHAQSECCPPYATTPLSGSKEKCSTDLLQSLKHNPQESSSWHKPVIPAPKTKMEKNGDQHWQ
jgi:hypothetical protein